MVDGTHCYVSLPGCIWKNTPFTSFTTKKGIWWCQINATKIQTSSDSSRFSGLPPKKRRAHHETKTTTVASVAETFYSFTSVSPGKRQLPYWKPTWNIKITFMTWDSVFNNECLCWLRLFDAFASIKCWWLQLLTVSLSGQAARKLLWKGLSPLVNT